MCVRARVGMFADIYMVRADTRGDIRVDSCLDMRVDACLDMGADMCSDMCIEDRRERRHVRRYFENRFPCVEDMNRKQVLVRLLELDSCA